MSPAWFLHSLPLHISNLHTWLPNFEGRFIISSLLAQVFLHKSCSTSVYCDPMDWGPPGSLFIRLFRQKYWSGLPHPPLCEQKYILRHCNYLMVSGGWYRMIPAYVVAGPSPPTRAPSQGTEFSGRKGKHSKTRAWTPQFSIKKKKNGRDGTVCCPSIVHN